MRRFRSPWRLARWVGLHFTPLLLSLALATFALPALAEDPDEPASMTPAPSALPAPAPPADPGGVPPPPVVDEGVEDDDPSALTEFRARLDPHGTWVDDPDYGRIWVPDRRVVGERFAPYVSSGHWSKVEDGSWVWVSDHPFGDVVFHYGRWVWTRYGWAWIPGHRYASAWVEWRAPSPSYDYYGWAPAPPTFVWMSGIAVTVGSPAPYYWVFCPSHYVFAPYPYGYIVTHPVYVRTLARRTRHFVPAWPAPRATERRQAVMAAPRPSAATPARVPHLTRVDYRRDAATTREVEFGRASDRAGRHAPHPSPPRPAPPEARRPSPPPLPQARPVQRWQPARVVSPSPKGYSPGHGNSPTRRR